MNAVPYSLIIHGGAGRALDEERVSESVTRILVAGRDLLARGASAQDVVLACVTALEDDPLFNAGKGSVLNEDGQVEMDASFMDGATLRAGAVVCVRGVKNPVRLARLVMEKTEHVLLMGEGASRFAKAQGLEEMPDSYFILPHRLAQLEEARRAEKIVLDHGDILEDRKFGTVGAVARDSAGNLAAATSTGGIVNKRFGRIGDTPLIGCGTYADNETCAISVTGYGEQIIRTALAKTISDLVMERGLAAPDAAREGMRYFLRKAKGLGGVIVVDTAGNRGVAHSTPGFVHGYTDAKGGPVAAFTGEKITA